MSLIPTIASYQRSRKHRFITSALLIALVLFAGLNQVQAQCTTCPLPTFQPPNAYPIGLLSYGGDREVLGAGHQILQGDFNNDGKPDLVVLSYFYGPPNLHLLLNDGSGGFGETIPILEAGSVVSMAAADFNGDHNLDLVVATTDSSLVLHGDGSGHFQLAGGGAGGGGIYSIWSTEMAVGDFNKDNKPDVFTRGNNTEWVNLGDGFSVNGSESCEYGNYIDDWPTDKFGVGIGDFDGDGNLDVLRYPGATMYFGDGTGGFKVANSGFAYPPELPWSGFAPTPRLFTIGDFNGDGRSDIATGLGTVYLSEGVAGFAPGVHYDLPTASQNGMSWDIQTADLNGDGKLDLVTVGQGMTSVLLGNGDGSFGNLTSFAGPDQLDSQKMAIADFNGDGKLDIASTSDDANYLNPRLVIRLNSTFQTPMGENSTVVVNNTTFTFDEVTSGGTTTVTPIDPASVGEVPGGFAVSDSVAYEIATTATFTGSVTLAFKVPGPISQEDFNDLAILHNVNGTLVDVTASTPPRDYANLTVYATTTSFSPFYLARRGPHIKSLFDQTKAFKRGSTIPIKLQVLNASNANVSSSSTSLVTRDLRLMSGNTLAPVEDSGNANPDYTFRYEPTLGGSGGGYIFNLSTKGLAAGQYVLSFYVGAERSFFYTVKFEVK